MRNEHLLFLRESLNLAKRAASRGEVPVGAVVSLEGRVIGWGYNQTRRKKSVLAHAEILALARAQKKKGDFRLEKARLYVVLEPCLMCLGAILLSRIKEIHYILPDPTFGSLQSVLKKKEKGAYRGVRFFRHRELEEEARELLRSFFVQLRKRR